MSSGDYLIPGLVEDNRFPADAGPGALEAWAVDLSERLLGDVPRRASHERAVIQRAREIRAVAGDDDEILVAAAALHDTGCSPAVRRCRLEHIDGGWFLQAVRAPQRVTNLVANLCCGWIEVELRGLREVHRVFEDEGPSAVRDAMWYCCMTRGRDGKPTTFEERAAVHQSEYAADPIQVAYFERATPELQAAIARTEQRLWDLGID
jgi:hypothetical protein